MFRNRTLTRVLWHHRFQIKALDCVRPGGSGLFIQPINIREQGTLAVEDSYVQKFMKTVGWMNKNRTKMKLCGYFLYECVPDKVNYSEWFKTCNLPDTFSSWFNITELHVWLLMVRCMAEDRTVAGKETYLKGDGYFIRNCIVEAMWADVSNRIKLLEGANPAIARKQVSELSEQFQAALVGYDEGLDDDKVLAAAIWRRFYNLLPETNPENLVLIVKFVRNQISKLDKLPSQQLKEKPAIEWISIKQ